MAAFWVAIGLRKVYYSVDLAHLAAVSFKTHAR